MVRKYVTVQAVFDYAMFNINMINSMVQKIQKYKTHHDMSK